MSISIKQNWKYNFGNLLIVAVLTAVITEFFKIAIPLIAYELRNSSTDVGWVRSISFIPNIFLAAFIGVIVDRYSKISALKTVSCLLAFVTWALYLSLSNGAQSIFVLSAFVFVIATIQYWHSNAFTSAVKSYVPNEKLSRANSLIGSTNSAVAVLGPTIVGFVLIVTSINNAVFYISFLSVIVFISLLFIKDLEQTRDKTDFFKSFSAGLFELKKNKYLLIMSLAVCVVNGTEGIFASMLIFTLKDVYSSSDLVLGIILSAKGIGSILGSIAVPYLRNLLGTGKTFVLPILGTAIIYLIFSSKLSIYLVGVLSFLEGFISMIFVVGLWTYRQESTPSEVIGRIAGLTGSIFKIGMPPMIILGGFITNEYGFTYAFLLAGLTNLLVFVCLFRTSLWQFGHSQQLVEQS